MTDERGTKTPRKKTRAARGGVGGSEREGAATEPVPSSQALQDRISALESTIEALEAQDDRAFALSHRVASLETRERELTELIIALREQIVRLGAERDALEERLGEESGRADSVQGQEPDMHAAIVERESLEARLADREEQLEELQTREREARAAIAERDEQTKRLKERIAKRERERDALQARLSEAAAGRDAHAAELHRIEQQHAGLLRRVEDLESSRSYRLMRSLWRINAALKRPFKRSGRRAEGLVDGSASRGPGDGRPLELPAAEPAQDVGEPARQMETAVSGPAANQPEVEVDTERRRWLARAALQRSPCELRVAAVMDEISMACFAPECDLIAFGAGDWREKLADREPHLLLVESTWQGNSGAWQYQVASYDHPDYAGLPNLKALLQWCTEREIPTVFWNKEDPVHFDRFSEAAVLFDYVVTSDSNCIPSYRALDGLRAKRVEALPFAAQPRIHNPVALSAERSDSPCFAGAYYRDRHIDRRRSLEMLLDAARPFGLVIYDRTSGSEAKAFGFPDRFRSHIRKRLPYDEMVSAYKSHKVFLNVNSVTDSPTMFSRRVFELLACDTAVISTESDGMAGIFGDLVPVVETPQAATEALERLLGDEDYRRGLVVPARRLVMSKHTYRQRLATIASVAGYDVSADRGEEFAVLVLVDDVDQARGISPLVASITEQGCAPAEVLIGVGARTTVAGDLHELSDASDGLRVRVTQQEATTSRRERYREIAALAVPPWLAIVHPAHFYGSDHFTDLLACTRFTDADVIGNAAFALTSGESINPDLEHRFVDLVHPHSVLVKRAVVAKRGWPDEPPESWATLNDWRQEGLRYYSGDRENFRADPDLGLAPGLANQISAAAPANR